MIRRAEIGKLAYRHQVPEGTIQKDYVITRFLREIAPGSTELGLRFKGGTCLKKCYFEDYRFSEDLDFTVEDEANAEASCLLLESAAERLTQAGLAVELPEPTRREQGLTYLARTGGPLGSEDKLKIDITTHELLMFDARSMPLLDTYSDADGMAELWCYALEEVFLEKVVCLLDPKRIQPRDLYDLVRLSETGSVDVEAVAWNFRAKAEFKGLDPSDLRGSIERKSQQLKRAWEERLAEQLPSGTLPGYEDSERSILRLFRQHGPLV